MPGTRRGSARLDGNRRENTDDTMTHAKPARFSRMLPRALPRILPGARLSIRQTICLAICLAICLTICLAAALTAALARTSGAVNQTESPRVEVRVGGYHFPPFVDTAIAPPQGVTIEVIALLNAMQDRYRFVFAPTSSTRRYADFQRGAYDVILFEDPRWGWGNVAHVASPSLMEGGEVFVAKAMHGRGQEFFRSLAGRRVLGFVGYHYAFAGFETDPAQLLQRHNTVLTTSHEGNILAVLQGDADLAVVTACHLDMLFHANPSLRERLLVGETPDQSTRHAALVRPGAPVTMDELRPWLQTLADSGALAALLGHPPTHCPVLPLP